ncbi:MAG: sulfotransferase family 2 domain-containing protein [Defluviimonas denitrificans]
MPIFRIGDRLHYYAHVPKCAGTSVEFYLAKRFGQLAFENRRFLSDPEPSRWTKSSPQHLPLEAFHKLIPEGWIASSFAVVRHPLKRLTSAFQFQVEVEKTVAPLWSIDEWFDDWLVRREAEPFLYDNHLRPMADLVPADAAAFRMEDGLDPVVAHLDRLAGNKEGPREIAAENVRKKAMSKDDPRMSPRPRRWRGSPRPMPRISPASAMPSTRSRNQGPRRETRGPQGPCRRADGRRG